MNKTTQLLNFIFLNMAFVEGNLETKNPKVQFATTEFSFTAVISPSEQGLLYTTILLIFFKAFSGCFPILFRKKKLLSIVRQLLPKT